MFMEYRMIFLPWRNSLQWARASSLSRIHDQNQTRHCRQDSSARVISPTQRHLHRQHTTHNRHSCHRRDSNLQFQQARGRRPTI